MGALCVGANLQQSKAASQARSSSSRPRPRAARSRCRSAYRLRGLVHPPGALNTTATGPKASPHVWCVRMCRVRSSLNFFLYGHDVIFMARLTQSHSPRLSPTPCPAHRFLFFCCACTRSARAVPSHSNKTRHGTARRVYTVTVYTHTPGAALRAAFSVHTRERRKHLSHPRVSVRCALPSQPPIPFTSHTERPSTPRTSHRARSASPPAFIHT